MTWIITQRLLLLQPLLWSVLLYLLKTTPSPSWRYRRISHQSRGFIAIAISLKSICQMGTWEIHPQVKACHFGYFLKKGSLHVTPRPLHSLSWIDTMTINQFHGHFPSWIDTLTIHRFHAPISWIRIRPQIPFQIFFLTKILFISTMKAQK